MTVVEPAESVVVIGITVPVVMGPVSEIFKSAKLPTLGCGLESRTVIGRASATVLGNAASRICSDNLRDWSTGYTIVRAGGLLWLRTELSSVELIHTQAEKATTALRTIIGAAHKAIYSQEGSAHVSSRKVLYFSA
jgi:hypothetical protein